MPLLCFYSMNIHYLQRILEPSTNSKLIYGPRAFPDILIRGISEPFCHWIDTWDANSQEGGCNLVHSFKVLFHGWLMLCFLRCSEAEHFGTRLWKNKTVYFMEAFSQEEKGKKIQPSRSSSKCPLLETKLKILPLGNNLCGLWIYWCNQSFHGPVTNLRFHLCTLLASGVKPLIPRAFWEATFYLSHRCRIGRLVCVLKLLDVSSATFLDGSAVWPHFKKHSSYSVALWLN